MRTLLFQEPATTGSYTLSLHDALPIWALTATLIGTRRGNHWPSRSTERVTASGSHAARSEEHTSELQSLTNLVCRLLLEKKKITCYLFKGADGACVDVVGL